MSMDVEFAIKTDIRNNPVVREVDLQQKREFRQTLTIIALVVAMLLFWAWPHLEVVRSGYNLEKVRLEFEAAAARNRHLRLELETQSAPQLIDERARGSLHLVPPTERDTVIVERVPASKPARAIVADARRHGAGR